MGIDKTVSITLEKLDVKTIQDKITMDVECYYDSGAYDIQSFMEPVFRHFQKFLEWNWVYFSLARNERK